MNKPLNIHTKVFMTNFELACEGGIFALVGDVAWVAHDVFYNGFSLWYGFIFTMLSLGLMITYYALHRHHVMMVAKGLKKRNYTKHRTYGDA